MAGLRPQTISIKTQPLGLEDVSALCALGQIGDAHLIQHPLAKRASLRRANRFLGHHRSSSIVTARGRTVLMADRRRSRC